MKVLAVVVAILACNAPGRRTFSDARPVDLDADFTIPDVAPPPFDAGPAPSVACDSAATDAGMQCALPASYCLDPHYLIYYTDGTCVDHQCQYATHWVYCYGGCIKSFDPSTGDGCSPGFT